MNDQKQKVRFGNIALFVVAGMLILTAWGNAVAMFSIAAAALGTILLCQRATGVNWPAALVAMVIASAVVFVAQIM